jgi:preprotein translocase subunit SecF
LKTVIDFLKYRYYAYLVSLSLVIIFSVGIYMHGGFTWGIDFIGGVKITAAFEKSVSINDLRKAFEKNGIGADIQQFGEDEQHEFIISTKLSSEDKSLDKNVENVINTLNKGFNNVKILSQETVGPAVGDFLRKSAIKLFGVALVLMMIYIAFRFEGKYSVAVLLTDLHDVFLALLFCGFMRVEINIPIVAAILTIFGYSQNDTIVIFDRVRENLQVKSKQTFNFIINASITETLSRTILTSLATLYCVVTLYAIGVGIISDFALVMLFGMIIGSYSTIYIASPIVLGWEKLMKK